MTSSRVTPAQRPLKLTKLERQMLARAADLIEAGEWPWESYKKAEGEALARASEKLKETL